MKALQRFHRRVRWCTVEDSVFVLDIKDGEYFALSSEMSRCWRDFAAGDAIDDEFVGVLNEIVGQFSLIPIRSRSGVIDSEEEPKRETPMAGGPSA